MFYLDLLLYLPSLLIYIYELEKIIARALLRFT